MPDLIKFYERHAAQRDRFEILAFHDSSVGSLQELDEKLRPIIRQRWGGKPLPFPILLDADRKTHRDIYGIQAYPTVILIDPEGRLVKKGGEKTLEQVLGGESEGDADEVK